MSGRAAQGRLRGVVSALPDRRPCVESSVLWVVEIKWRAARRLSSQLRARREAERVENINCIRLAESSWAYIARIQFIHGLRCGRIRWRRPGAAVTEHFRITNVLSGCSGKQIFPERNRLNILDWRIRVKILREHTGRREIVHPRLRILHAHWLRKISLFQ